MSVNIQGLTGILCKPMVVNTCFKIYNGQDYFLKYCTPLLNKPPFSLYAFIGTILHGLIEDFLKIHGIIFKYFEITSPFCAKGSEI